MKRLVFGALVSAGMMLAGTAMAQNKVTMSIVTGGTGGVYYPLGGGLANLLTKYVPGWQATAEVTGGSVANLQLIGSKKAEIAFTMADAALDAQQGQDKFQGNKVPQRLLAVLYPNIMHVVSVEGTGITKMADLKGKRVSTGSPGSATEVMGFRVIEAAGLDKDKDMRRERLGVAESTNALKDKKIDAYFWVGGLPTAGVTDLAATPGVKIALIDHEATVAGMNQKFGPLYAQAVIPANTYPGQVKEAKVASVWNLLVVHESMADDMAYNIVKTIFEHRAEWAQVHAEAKNVKPENQKQPNSPIKWHPGAEKYFKEKGINIM
ncbi:MAG: TAXI family TRAP transporter solute-binding subunit [Alphaproteobacteria bacterium]|nr:TAXI family TRAP transporter solute-binding subunit [Alphaproteobacteria bacterium]